MNSLSWLVYLADVLSNLRGLMIFMAVCGLAISILLFILQAATYETYTKLFISWWVVIFCIFLTICIAVTSAIIPSRETMYMIAASEAGEMVVNSPEARELLSDVKTVIKTQLDKLKGNTN